jgi:hypothetical protein
MVAVVAGNRTSIAAGDMKKTARYFYLAASIVAYGGGTLNEVPYVPIYMEFK